MAEASSADARHYLGVMGLWADRPAPKSCKHHCCRMFESDVDHQPVWSLRGSSRRPRETPHSSAFLKAIFGANSNKLSWVRSPSRDGSESPIIQSGGTPRGLARLRSAAEQHRAAESAGTRQLAKRRWVNESTLACLPGKGARLHRRLPYLPLTTPSLWRSHTHYNPLGRNCYCRRRRCAWL